MTDREKVIKGLEQFKADFKPFCGSKSDWARVDDALALLREQKSEWLEDSDPGQEYGTTWACAECGCSIHEHTVWNPYRAGFKYCPFCGKRMVLKRDG